MKISKAVVDSNIRSAIFSALNVANIEGFHKINDRQYGCIVEDVNGTRRYARVGVIVAEERAEKAKKDVERREKAKREKEGE